CPLERPPGAQLAVMPPGEGGEFRRDLPYIGIPMSARTRLVATFAAEQFGVIARRQMRALGIPEATIADWVRAKWLHRIHRGVYAVGHVALRWEGRLVAAALAGGERAQVSHRSGGAWLGLRGTT